MCINSKITRLDYLESEECNQSACLRLLAYVRTSNSILFYDPSLINNQFRQMNPVHGVEERLRECACLGERDTVQLLIQRGVNINSQHKINGW